MYYSTTYQSPVGLLTLACDGDNLAGLWIEGQKYHGNTIHEAMTEKENIPVFTAVQSWLDSYFAGDNPDITKLPLHPMGSDFRKEVWNILRKIPYGELISYGDIAKKIAANRNMENFSSRAVGGAVGHNPISIIIPCHRVVGATGSLTGFSAGIIVKIKLLELEGIDISKLSVPTKGTAL